MLMGAAGGAAAGLVGGALLANALGMLRSRHLTEIIAGDLKMAMTITVRAEDTGVVVILKEAAIPLVAISRMRQLREARSVAVIRKRLRRLDRSMRKLMRKRMGLTEVDERLPRIEPQFSKCLRPREYLISQTQKRLHC